MDNFFDACQQQCVCGNKEYNVLYLGTPSTPPDIQAVKIRCTQCGKHEHIQIIYYHAPAALVDQLNLSVSGH